MGVSIFVFIINLHTHTHTHTLKNGDTSSEGSNLVTLLVTLWNFAPRVRDGRCKDRINAVFSLTYVYTSQI